MRAAGARFHYRQRVSGPTSLGGVLKDRLMGSCRMETAVTPDGRHHDARMVGRFIYERCQRCRRVSVSYWALERELPIAIPASPFGEPADGHPPR